MHLVPVRLLGMIVSLVAFVTGFMPATSVTADTVLQVMPTATCPVSLPAGEVFDCAIGGNNEIDSFSLSAQQNDAWYFRIQRTAGDLQPYIDLRDPNDNQTCFGSTTSDYVSISCSISVGGIYTLRVRDRLTNSGRTGSYLIYGQRTNSPFASTSVGFGTQPSAAIQATLEDDVYHFSATINDKLIVRIWRTTGALQPRIYAYDSTGVQLCGSSTTGPYVGLDCTVNKTDTYYIIIGDRLAANTGAYTLHIQRRNNPGNASALVHGVPVSGAVSVPGELDTFTFAAAANDKAFLRVKRTSGDLQPALYVYDRSGDVICSDTTTGTFAAFDCAIAQAGTYTVIMNDRLAAGTGDYMLYLQRTNNPGNPTGLTFGQTVDGTIEAIGAYDTYTFVPKQNDRVSVSLARTSGGMDFLASIYNSVGERICFNSTTGTTLTISNCAITADGTHTLLVFDRNDDAVGTYTLGITCLSSSCVPAPVETVRQFIPFAAR